MMPHDTQLWGEVNSIACDKSMKSDIVGEGDGKGSVSKIQKRLVWNAKLMKLRETTKTICFAGWEIMINFTHPKS